ncbi:MAG: ankyrin repeat domain-containing protein [Candidatus Sulfotelmatobacter sp.]
MVSPTAKHIRRTTWAIAGLEAGAVLFVAGLVVLYLNPYWHFDERGFLDWRVPLWNTSGEILIAAGFSIEALALVGLAAVLVSRFANRRFWPYVVAALLVVCTAVWISPAGFTRNLDAHFEWNVADGFNVLRLQTWDEAAGAWRPAGGPVWQSTVGIQIQPLLRGYFKLNDWQKMNGDIGIKVVRIIPIAWPIELGRGGETLEDPDETELMRAAAQEDLKAVQRLLPAATGARVNAPGVNALGVNALDQTGQTALILACQNPKANPDVVRALLAAGADVNLRSRTGYTALTWAQVRNNGEVIRLLRRAGGKP